MKRYTFVVQVHPDGVSTLENLTTQERLRVLELASVGPQIERWLAEARRDVGPPDVTTPPAPSSVPAPSESGPG